MVTAGNIPVAVVVVDEGVPKVNPAAVLAVKLKLGIAVAVVVVDVDVGCINAKVAATVADDTAVVLGVAAKTRYILLNYCCCK